VRRLGLLVVVLLALSPVAASGRTNTFDGTCRLSGRLDFAQPLGNDLRATTLVDVASGTCTGRVNGRFRRDAPVVNHATGAGTLSCLAGSATTADALSFGHGVTVRFSTVTFGGLTQFAARFHGDRGGDGVVQVSFLPYTDQSALAACQAGTFASARYDLVARTLTPVSG
jgi:hypothetical protein